MFKTEGAEGAGAELSAEAIREQLELLVRDHAFRSSKRSVQFPRYVVEQTLKDSADQIKERTIGVEVFGREPSYDTNIDHVVRTAAIELRKRLAIYYGDERHRSELRMSLVPGSYIPRFTLASQVPPTAHETEAGSESAHFHFQVSAHSGGSAPHPLNSDRVAATVPRVRHRMAIYASCAAAVLLLFGVLSYNWRSSMPKLAGWRVWRQSISSGVPDLCALIRDAQKRVGKSRRFV
jgi:hypothetical protein